MREIIPVTNLSVDEYMAVMPKTHYEHVNNIRQQKIAGVRLQPSTSLIDQSILLTPKIRSSLLDRVANLVDENIFGRSEMCEQFADLLRLALTHLGLPARGAVGISNYYVEGREVFSWKHAWVRINNEVIDANVDSLFENPLVPKSISICPYWGPIKNVPKDRGLIENKSVIFPKNDVDVEKIWWPDLREWINKEL